MYMNVTVKKYMLIIVVVAVFASLVLLPNSIVYAISEHTITQEEVDQAKIEEKRNVEYNRLQEYVETYTDDEKGFSETYGGAYIQNEKLVVLLKNNTEQFRSLACEIAMSDSLLFQEADYSFLFLKSIIDNSAAKFQKRNLETNRDLGAIKGFQYASIDIKANRVVICYCSNKDDWEDVFRREIIDDDCLVFVKNDQNSENSADRRQEETGEPISLQEGTKSSYYIKPGQKIVTIGTSKKYSLGYKAKYSTSAGWRYGYVTAGHDLTVGGKFGTSSTATAHSRVIQRYCIGSDADVSFEEVINSDYSVNNKVYGTDYTITSAAQTYNVAVGTTVYSCGTTSGVRSGTVTSINSYDANGTTGLSIATYSSAGGDSGGPVYTVNSLYSVTAVGIHSSSVSSTSAAFTTTRKVYQKGFEFVP